MDQLETKYQTILLRLSAHDRAERPNETNSDFTLDVRSQNIELKKITAITVVNCQIPNVFYNIRAPYSTFNFTDEFDNECTATVADGNYDVNQFMLELMKQIDIALSLPEGSSTYEFNEITYKVSFTTGAIIKFYSTEDSNELAYRMGFGDDATLQYSGTTFNGINIIDLTGPHIVSIHSPDLARGALDYGSRSGTVKMIAQIPLDKPFGFLCYYSSNSSADLIKYQSPKSLNQIRLILRDVKGRRLDIGTMDWNITIRVYYLL